MRGGRSFMRANELSRIVVLLIGVSTFSCMQTTAAIKETRMNPGEERIQLKVTGARLLDASTQEESTSSATMAETEPQENGEKKESESGAPAETEQGEVLELSAEKKSADEQASQQEEKKAANPAEEKVASPFDPEALFLRTIEEVIPDNRPITIERSESLTVPQLLEAIGKFGGFNVAIADGLETLKIARVNFPNIPLRDAFIAVLKRYQLNITRVGDVLWIDRGNRAGDEMIFRIFRLSSISAESLRTQLQAILAGGVSTGTTTTGTAAAPATGASASTSGTAASGGTSAGYFTIHPDSNTIFLRAKPEMIEAMTKFISAVDFRGQQVMIEMKIFEVSLNDNTSIGAFMSATDLLSFGNGSNQIVAGESDFLFNLDKTQADPLIGLRGIYTAPDSLLTYNLGSRINGDLEFLQTMTKTDLISAPKIVAVNGKEAEINIIDKIPYRQATQQTSVSGGSESSTETLTFEEVGIKLKVTPTIQEDKHIRMAIEPEISEMVERATSTNDPLAIPTIVKRTSKTEMVVANGESFVLGGLMKTLSITQEKKIPLLGDLPLIGFLFRSTSDTTKKTEMLILITPTLLEEPGLTAKFMKEEKDRLDQSRKAIWKKRYE